MALLVILLFTVALASAQSCSCESSSHEFTDLIYNCPIDHFCTDDSLVAGSCGQTCHASGSFHSSPYDHTDPAVIIGSHNCAGPLFDFDNGGSVMCAYSTPSTVLSTSHACNVPIFNCNGCDSSALRYVDYDAEYSLILCESGLLQYTYADNTTLEYDYRIGLNKNTCEISGGHDNSQIITSVSCKSRPYEVDGCIQEAGSPAGLTGHCHFGTCWLYCQDITKQLSFQRQLHGAGTRIYADALVCVSSFVQYGLGSAFHLECN